MAFRIWAQGRFLSPLKKCVIYLIFDQMADVIRETGLSNF
jgi:hypothetical protein